MRIDTSFPSSTATSTQPQRVHSARHEMETHNGADPGEVQQGGPTAQILPTVAVPRTARGSDTTHISGVAPSISDLATAVHTAADVRSTKVQSLRQAVDQGTYQVSPERIAQSMLAQATSKLR
jgi:flagellar biosynthesis anti-sigma factor FlgM